MKHIALLLLVLLSGYVSASAPIVTSSPTKVVLISSYNAYGGGDVIFRVGQPHPSCEQGYWLTKSDPGFQANLSMIIAAKQSGSTVRVVAHPDQLWSGSGGAYCKLYAFNIE